jgi:hypothetical protein
LRKQEIEKNGKECNYETEAGQKDENEQSVMMESKQKKGRRR